ncbi:hypothetical protein F4677DRAFT_42677 [Hypoxylon crocopeplum]|nr:hypothetical protein F4677DRAFT_42677 [Hypoxylon crocopeplum]
MGSPSDSQGPDDDLCLFRCTLSDGKAFEETRFPAVHKPTDGGADLWLSKLGEMVGDQFYPGARHKFQLEGFPEHYHLRARNRVGPGNRQDYYLYGYPDDKGEAQASNRKTKPPPLKYFKSPSEFIDHLMWLITTPNLEEKNCGCKLCTPQSTGSEPPPAAGTPTMATSLPSGGSSGGPSAAPRRQSPALPAAPGGPPPVLLAHLPPPATATSPAPSAPPSVAPKASRKKAGSTPSTTKAAPVPVPDIVQPQIDESFLFREGEIVWYRKVQEAFRLGIIIQNLPGDPATPFSRRSMIKPLSHFFRPIEDVERLEADMRPFLTFSVPAITPGLQTIAEQPMQNVPWDVVESRLQVDDKMRGEILSLEASKIAATRVDHSYSVFNPIMNPHATPHQQGFGGVFLGCEKVGIFEAIRVRLEQHEHPEWDNHEFTFAMVLKNLVIQRTEEGEHLLFHGDIWLLQETASPHHSPNLDQLPAAMRREKNFRDEVKRAHGTHFDWVPIVANVTKPEGSIRGRFYESHKLGPMLNPDWNQYLQNGLIPPIQKSLNNRFDSRGSYIGRKKSRLDAVAGAVPLDTVLSLGPRVVEWA